jgi:hypothetical protein
MDLATHQRKLLELFRTPDHKSANVWDNDPYIRKVAQSRDLYEARGNILLWRIYVLERTAPLTFTLLKQRKLLREVVGDFIAHHNISPFRETQAPAFLDSAGRHPDSLIAAVARFELALLKVRQGDRGDYVISWNVDPSAILYCLAKSIPLPDDIPEGTYEVLISHTLPFQFVIRDAPAA